MIRRFLFSLLAVYLVLWITHLHLKSNAVASRPAHVSDYVQAFGSIAGKVGRENGIPPAIILAVAGLESAWGKSELSRRGNHFGIKAWGNERKHCLPTQEFTQKKARRVQACFRAYDHPEDSFRDFGNLLKNRSNYQPLFKFSGTDYRRWARGLSECGYATDPEYGEKLIRIIEQYRLDAF